MNAPCAFVRKEGEDAAAAHTFLSFALAITVQIPMLYDVSLDACFFTCLIQISAACAPEEGLFLIWISHHDDLFFKASEDIFLFYPISSSH